MKVPTPSGSEQLSRAVVVNWQTHHLNVVSEFDYDDTGNLVGITDSYDPVGTIASLQYKDGLKYGSDDDFVTDAQERLIEFHNFGNDSLIDYYRYGDDPACYTMINARNGVTSFEQTHTLENERLPAWITKSPDELYPNGIFRLDDDGLIVMEGYRYKETADDELKIKETNYSNRVETYEDGSLHSVLRIHEDGYADKIMEFDRAGYLVYYKTPLSPSKEIYYYYE